MPCKLVASGTSGVTSKGQTSFALAGNRPILHSKLLRLLRDLKLGVFAKVKGYWQEALCLNK